MTDTPIVPPTTEAPSGEKSIAEVPKQTEDVEMKENGDRTKSNNGTVEPVKSAEETNEKEDNGTNEDGDDDEDFLNAVSSNKDPDTPTRSKRKVVHYPKNDEEVKTPKPKNRRSSAGTLSFRDASYQLLQSEGGPLSAQVLAKRVIEQGLVSTTGKTPDRTIAAMIYNEIRHKPSCPFKLISPGVFGLKEFDGESPEEEAEENDEEYKSKKKSKKSTPKKRKTPTKKDATPKKKRKISHKEDKEEAEEDIDNDILDAISKNITEEKAAVEKKEETPAPRPMGKKQKILDKVKQDNEAPKVEEKKEVAYIPPARQKGYQQEGAAYGYKYLKYFLDLSQRSTEKDENSENDCFICKGGGKLVCCDFPKCRKVYHKECLELETIPKGKWICLHHYCIECLKHGKSLSSPNAITQCTTCPTSYCAEHLTGGQTESNLDKSQIICSDCLPHFKKLESLDEEENEAEKQ